MAKKTDKTREKLIEYNETYKKNTGSPLKDNIYNRLVDRYTRNNREWDTSDIIVWGGAVYTVTDSISYVIFFTLFIFLAGVLIKRYGDVKAIMYFILLLMWRLQIIIKQLTKINKTMGG